MLRSRPGRATRANRARSTRPNSRTSGTPPCSMCLDCDSALERGQRRRGVAPCPCPIVSLSRRDAMKRLLAAALASGIMLIGAQADAQTWPTKPIHVIIGFTPGNAVDVIPRTVFEQLSSELGQPII